ncbi:MAG: hypothetical protein JXA10_02335 [Anaerolineae bacterium]|nr:hypothetical protein [Anaerolineae bacterium]
MYTNTIQVGRVIRFGRGWADVTIEQKVRRINVRPDLLVRVGAYLKIINEQGVAVLPSYERHTSDLLQ